MLKLKDVRVTGDDFYISLVKLTGTQIKDIKGYLTSEFGDAVFQMCEVVFEDGTELACEGEHDLPYLDAYPQNTPANMDADTLNELYHEGLGV